jgi:hypothetical protein
MVGLQTASLAAAAACVVVSVEGAGGCSGLPAAAAAAAAAAAPPVVSSITNGNVLGSSDRSSSWAMWLQARSPCQGILTLLLQGTGATVRQLLGAENLVAGRAGDAGRAAQGHTAAHYEACCIIKHSANSIIGMTERLPVC